MSTDGIALKAFTVPGTLPSLTAFRGLGGGRITTKHARLTWDPNTGAVLIECKTGESVVWLNGAFLEVAK